MNFWPDGPRQHVNQHVLVLTLVHSHGLINVVLVLSILDQVLSDQQLTNDGVQFAKVKLWQRYSLQSKGAERNLDLPALCMRV